MRLEENVGGRADDAIIASRIEIGLRVTDLKSGSGAKTNDATPWTPALLGAAKTVAHDGSSLRW